MLRRPGGRQNEREWVTTSDAVQACDIAIAYAQALEQSPGFGIVERPERQAAET
jgi:hypothetical protein